MALAPSFDFVIFENATPPRCIVYNIDTGAELATWAGTDPLAQASCIAYCAALCEAESREEDAAVTAAANLSPAALVEAAQNAQDLDNEDYLDDED